MEKSYKIVRLYKEVFIVILIFFLSSCSNKGVVRDGVQLNESHRTVVDTIYLTGDYNFMPGNIASFKQINKKSYLFLDFARRMLLHLDENKNKVFEVSKHGDGPGEYRMPSSFQLVGTNRIAFTDISTMSFEVIDKDGNLIHQFNHGLGGGKEFLVLNGNIYFLGGLTHNPEGNYKQLSIYNSDGEKKAELFPIKSEYEYIVRNLGMGGITNFNGQVVFMNSIEPVIYIYNLVTKEKKEVKPFQSRIYLINDVEVLNSYDLNELRLAFNNELVNFHSLDTIEISEQDYLAVGTRRGEEFITYFIDENFTVQYHYISSKDILGIQNEYIFESDVLNNSGVIEKAKLSISGTSDG